MSYLIDAIEPIKANDEQYDALVAHIVQRVNAWEQHRNQHYASKWDEYYRMWKCQWSDKDRARKSERSHAIMPTTQQAVETIVAEEEEAMFGRPNWIVFDDPDTTDVPEELLQQWKQQLAVVNKRLLADFDEADVPSSVVKALLNGSIYGTGIGKVRVEVVTEYVPAGDGGYTPREVVRVGLDDVSPYEFVIDPSASTIDDAYGMATMCEVPLHTVWRKQRDKIYRDVPIDAWDSTGKRMFDGAPKSLLPSTDEADTAHIIEYHGLVPAGLFKRGKKADEDDHDLIEVIATIGNKKEVLRILRNPFPMEDRCFVSFQQDTVPGEFWGRGTVEKGYWPQKVLDSEVRARNDALAFSTAPMTLTDGTRVGARGANFEVRAGRNILVNGDPTNAVSVLKFPPPDPQSFQQAAEMERMVEMSTGAIQAATSSAVNSRNSTATGMSIIQGAVIKRSKRTLQNVERNFLRKFVKKALLRLMEYAPERYPFLDYNFRINATMGIMAREFEQQQLIALLQTAPAGSPVYWMLLHSIYDNSSLSNRDQMQMLIAQMFQQSQQPPPEKPDLGGIARMRSVEQREKEHEDNLRLEYRKLEQKDEEGSKNRRNDLAKEFMK